MNRRNAFKFLSILGLAPLAVRVQASTPVVAPEIVDRKYWLKVLIKIADPLLDSLSRGELRKNMPVECKSGMDADRRKVTCLEAFGRLMAGMSPWLELGADETEEGQLREKIYCTSAEKHENGS